MDRLSQTFLTILLCLVSTALTQTSISKSTATSGSTPNSNVISGSTPNSNVTSGSTPNSNVTSGSTPNSNVTSDSTPNSNVTSGSTPNSNVTSGSTPISTATTSGSSPISTATTSGSSPISTATTSGSSPISTATTSGSSPISTATTSGSSPSSNTTVSPITPTVSPTTGDKTPKWNLEKDGIYCILLQMQTQIHFNLNISNVVENLKFVILENNTNLNTGMSNCYGSSKLMLDFEDKVTGSKLYTIKGSLAFTFQNQSTSSYNLESVELAFSVDTRTFPNLSYNMTIKVKEGQAYQCLSKDKRKISDEVTIDFQQFEFEAFRNSNTTTFDKFDVCPNDDNTSDVVPIAVGCALAGLVIIVLVAYLIGRRRNRQRGYQSV